jgi:hypothetical protein
VERNPYSPPISPIADVVADLPTLETNREVMLASKLIWASLVVSLVGMVHEFLSRSALAIRLSVAVVAVISVGFSWWNVSKLKAGRNWMRILVTIIYVFSYFSIVGLWQSYYAKVFADYPENAIKAVVFVINTMLSVVIVVIINLPSARAWFSRMKQRR